MDGCKQVTRFNALLNALCVYMITKASTCGVLDAAAVCFPTTPLLFSPLHAGRHAELEFFICNEDLHNDKGDQVSCNRRRGGSTLKVCNLEGALQLQSRAEGRATYGLNMSN